MFWRSAVRSDTNQSTEYQQSKAWDQGETRNEKAIGINSTLVNNVLTKTPDGALALQSFSGHERNKLFLNQQGSQFKDVSSLSGMDTAADSRSVALWDFDHDGWQDVAVINTNTPLLNIFRNQVGAREGIKGNFIAVRFHGGNRDRNPTPQWSNRDGIGAEITAICGDRKYVREQRCGEGFASQSSLTMTIGIGEATEADSLQIRWPSGKTQKIGKISAGKLLSVYENPVHSDNSQGYVVSPYTAVASSFAKPARLADFDWESENFGDVESDKFRVYVATATWCPSCKKGLPQLALLKEKFGDRVDFYGVPVDRRDDKLKLEKYVSTYRPAYTVLDNLTDEEHQNIFNMFITVVGRGALPSVFVLDNEGRVLGAAAEVPTVSWLEKVIRSH